MKKKLLTLTLLICGFTITAEAQLGLFGAKKKRKEEEERRSQESAKAFADYPNGNMPKEMYTKVCLPESELQDPETEQAFMDVYNRKSAAGSGGYKGTVKKAIPIGQWRISRDQYTGAIIRRSIWVTMAYTDAGKCYTVSTYFTEEWNGMSYQKVPDIGETLYYEKKELNCNCLDKVYTQAASAGN